MHLTTAWLHGLRPPLLMCMHLTTARLYYAAVLRIDPLKDEVDVVGGPYPGFEKWEGGVLSRTGAMYCMPLKSKQVLKMTRAGSRLEP